MAATKPRDAWQETTASKMYVDRVWMVKAACLGHPDRECFFPEIGRIDRVLVAKKICADCSVWKDCLTFALENKEQHDIWGGLSLKERNQVRSSNGVRKCLNCGLIKVFKQKEQSICSACEHPRSRNLKRSG